MWNVINYANWKPIESRPFLLWVSFHAVSTNIGFENIILFCKRNASFPFKVTHTIEVKTAFSIRSNWEKICHILAVLISFERINLCWKVVIIKPTSSLSKACFTPSEFLLWKLCYDNQRCVYRNTAAASIHEEPTALNVHIIVTQFEGDFMGGLL